MHTVLSCVTTNSTVSVHVLSLSFRVLSFAFSSSRNEKTSRALSLVGAFPFISWGWEVVDSKNHLNSFMSKRSASEMANGSPTEGEPMVRDSRDLIIFRRRLFSVGGSSQGISWRSKHHSALLEEGRRTLILLPSSLQCYWYVYQYAVAVCSEQWFACVKSIEAKEDEVSISWIRVTHTPMNSLFHRKLIIQNVGLSSLSWAVHLRSLMNRAPCLWESLKPSRTLTEKPWRK